MVEELKGALGDVKPTSLAWHATSDLLINVLILSAFILPTDKRILLRLRPLHFLPLTINEQVPMRGSRPMWHIGTKPLS